MFRSKFGNFLSFLKEQIRFSSNFTSIFSVMRHTPPTLFLAEILYTFNKRSLSSINWVKFHLSSQTSEILHFNSCPNRIKFQLKSSGELSLITLKSEANFEKKTLRYKNDMRNLVNFNVNSDTSENLSFDVLLLSKVYYV